MRWIVCAPSAVDAHVLRFALLSREKADEGTTPGECLLSPEEPTPYDQQTMFKTDTSLHDLQDQLRDELRRDRRQLLAINILAIALGVGLVGLYWYLH